MSWDKVIYALQKSGHTNIADKISRDIFNSDNPSTNNPSTDHKRHEQSPNTFGKLYMINYDVFVNLL